EGRVVDENDAPVAGLKVRARLADFTNSVSWRSGLTDANGRFELRGCDEGLHRVEIYDADNDEQPLTVVAGLEPRPLPHLIRLDAGSRASAWLTGRLVSSDGEAAPGATVVIFGEGILAASSRPVDASTGGFRFGPFPSGDLQLFIEAPGQVALSRQVTVEAAKTLDLGTIRFPRPGYFEGVLKVGDGGPRGLPSGSIVTPDRQHRDFRVEGDRVLSPPLAPGLHTLQISVAGRIERSIGFVIHEGETTRAELVLEPGCPIRIRFEEQAEDAAVRVKSFRLRLASISGVPVFDHEYRVKDGVGFRLDHVLAPGEYRLELRNDLGGEHSESFVLAAPGGPERLFTMRIGGR
ncbi:MAG: carboxypeptidase regulatory-like domain-containing protein, partial [Planctomycetes bacterium]|nr:carboxypeptidase regulatory-like domain-containing protein [Planctomycetota bacterium]